jgi:hypothetical protein
MPQPAPRLIHRLAPTDSTRPQHRGQVTGLDAEGRPRLARLAPANPAVDPAAAPSVDQRVIPAGHHPYLWLLYRSAYVAGGLGRGGERGGS